MVCCPILLIQASILRVTVFAALPDDDLLRVAQTCRYLHSATRKTLEERSKKHFPKTKEDPFNVVALCHFDELFERDRIIDSRVALEMFCGKKRDDLRLIPWLEAAFEEFGGAKGLQVAVLARSVKKYTDQKGSNRFLDCYGLRREDLSVCQLREFDRNSNSVRECLAQHAIARIEQRVSKELYKRGWSLVLENELFAHVHSYFGAWREWRTVDGIMSGLRRRRVASAFESRVLKCDSKVQKFMEKRDGLLFLKSLAGPEDLSGYVEGRNDDLDGVLGALKNVWMSRVEKWNSATIGIDSLELDQNFFVHLLLQDFQVGFFGSDSTKRNEANILSRVFRHENETERKEMVQRFVEIREYFEASDDSYWDDSNSDLYWCSCLPRQAYVLLQISKQDWKDALTRFEFHVDSFDASSFPDRWTWMSTVDDFVNGKLPEDRFNRLSLENNFKKTLLDHGFFEGYSLALPDEELMECLNLPDEELMECLERAEGNSVVFVLRHESLLKEFFKDYILRKLSDEQWNEMVSRVEQVDKLVSCPLEKGPISESIKRFVSLESDNDAFILRFKKVAKFLELRSHGGQLIYPEHGRYTKAMSPFWESHLAPFICGDENVTLDSVQEEFDRVQKSVLDKKKPAQKK